MTAVTEKRNTTKEDVLLEARLRSEGARIEVKEASEPRNANRNIVIDGCELVTSARQNPASRLEVIIDGDDVTISDMGEVLGTGTLEVRPSWRDQLLSDGTTVQDAAMWNAADIAVIILFGGCSIHDAGSSCKYCFMSGRPAGSSMQPSDTARNVEAAVIALQSGWRGTIFFSGGTPTPSQRGRLTDDIERIMTQFRESIDGEILSQVHFSVALPPAPGDLGELYKWRDFGINSTKFDSQVMDPDYFKAICPGRGEQSRWHEAHEASVEVFGRGRGTITGVVMGLEPMAGLVEGVEERIKRGVFAQVPTWNPVPGSPMGGMRPPSAEWFVEAAEKIADVYLRYADTFDVDLTEDTRFGWTRKGRSYSMSIVDDEMIRRLQEMGKLPPGLPKQDG